MESKGAGEATAPQAPSWWPQARLKRVLQDLCEALPCPGHQGCRPSCSGGTQLLQMREETQHSNGAMLNVEVQPLE